MREVALSIGSRVFLCAVGVLLSAGPIGACFGQTAERYAADAVARVALLDLRARPNASPDDYLVAGSVIGAARRFAPEDAQLLRAHVRSAWAAGQRELLETLTRDLVRLDPRDTVAQLRLASARIGAMQTVEQRLAAYDRLLSSAADSIDPSVRSRLALDAALLHREHNNFAGYADRLAQALQLDPTNKEAAQLAWQSFSPMMETPAERFELLLNLLMADPTDPNVHRLVAQELASVGAFEQARRFHNLSLTLYVSADSAVAEDLVLESAGLRWQIEGPEEVVENLNRELNVMRQEAAARIRQFEEARMPTDALPKPDQIMLSPRYNQMRLVAALTADDEETVAACLSDMQLTFNRLLQAHQERMRLSTPEEIEQSAATIWADLSRQLVAIAWADVQDASLREWADRAAALFGPGSGVARALDAWAQLRLGDPAIAVETFRDLRDVSVLNRVGLALALEETGDVDAALQEYRSLSRDQPLTLSGAWARDRVRRLTGADALDSPERTALDAMARDVPAWVDRMVQNPRAFMSISAHLLEDEIAATERPVLRVRITNLAPVPLAVGGDRPLNSRFMLAPRLQAGLGSEFARALPEIVELDQRLRLRPTESLQADLWPEAGMVGWLAEVSALDTVRQRWRVLQGYRLSADGLPQPGVLCLETETDRLLRRPLLLADATAMDLADALDTSALSDLPGVAAAIRARILAPADSPRAIRGDDVSRLATIAADRYETLPPAGRAILLAVLPSRMLSPQMEPFDRVALREADPDLATVALVTRVTEPQDEALLSRLESEDESLASFARALQSRLESPEPTFSRLGRAMLGPVQPPAELSAGGGR